MTSWLKQSTAVDLPIGPFLDSTDGNTVESGLTLTQPDIRLKKNGGAWAQKSAAQTLSHEEAGWYEVSLSATDTDTLGLLMLAVHESGALPVWREFMVVPANIYDSLISGSDFLQADLQQWRGTQPTALSGSNYVQADVLAANGGTGGARWLAAMALRHSVSLQGATSTTATLDTGANATNQFFRGCILIIFSGTGSGQARRVLSYDGTTKVCVVSPAWAVNPTTGSGYLMMQWVDMSTGSGLGALTRTIGITAGGNPVEGASVWVTTDEAGTNVVAAAVTDSMGEATLLLDAGTYYVFMQADGFEAIIGEEIEVTA